VLPPFGWQAAVTQWQSAPAVSCAVAVAAVLYCWGAIRVARRHPARPWPAWRTACFLGGLAIIVVALQSGVGSYDDVLFWDHMVQHLMLIMIAPPLLILGEPITLLLHASRNPVHTWVKRAVRSRLASFLTWPVFGFAAYTAAVLGAHLTSWATLIDQNAVAHESEHLLFILAGYLFFLPVLGREPIRWRLSYPVRLGLLALIMPVDTFTGVVLGYAGASAPGAPQGPRPAWAPTPVADLHAGGAVMWVGGAAVMFALIMLLFGMWATDPRRSVASKGWLEAARRSAVPAAAGEGAARGIDDDDEHLAAYNAYLARLNQGRHADRGF
jgi:cytochrome c oxidase assembly factor CtaG